MAAGASDVRAGDRTAPDLVFVHHRSGSADTRNDVIGDPPPGRATVCFDRRGRRAPQALPGPCHLVQPAGGLGGRREARSSLRPGPKTGGQG
ncbi:hypothetical protein GCM10010297_41590 [Streptomyces malachitofuscus]|nr:hypothetical protein GCM10010297_41590 [Streptomyces malachitofuscus]